MRSLNQLNVTADTTRHPLSRHYFNYVVGTVATFFWEEGTRVTTCFNPKSAANSERINNRCFTSISAVPCLLALWVDEIPIWARNHFHVHLIARFIPEWWSPACLHYNTWCGLHHPLYTFARRLQWQPPISFIVPTAILLVSHPKKRNESYLGGLYLLE